MNREDNDLLLRESVNILKEMRTVVNERLDTGLIEELDSVIENLEKLENSVAMPNDKRAKALESLGRGAALLSLIRAIGTIFRDSS
jgi:hypothetical protein